MHFPLLRLSLLVVSFSQLEKKKAHLINNNKNNDTIIVKQKEGGICSGGNEIKEINNWKQGSKKGSTWLWGRKETLFYMQERIKTREEAKEGGRKEGEREREAKRVRERREREGEGEREKEKREREGGRERVRIREGGKREEG